MCITLDEKVSTSSLFVVLTASFKVVGSTVWFVVVSFQIESPAQQQANNWTILDPFRETNGQLISLSLIMLMIQLMVGVPRVTSTQSLNPVESGTTMAT